MSLTKFPAPCFHASVYVGPENWEKLMSLTKFPAPCFHASDYVKSQNWKKLMSLTKFPAPDLATLLLGCAVVCRRVQLKRSRSVAWALRSVEPPPI